MNVQQSEKVYIFSNVTVVPGRGVAAIKNADVSIDEAGIVTAITPNDTAPEEMSGAPAPGRYLLPAAVDLHLDNLVERRTPRATVTLNIRTVIAALDAEAASAGIGTVCIAARCEDAPGKGVLVEDAILVAEAIEEMHPRLACDWRIHARVEVTDDTAVDALSSILDRSTRVALISVMEHSVERSRFSSPEEHRKFYAEDWGVSLAKVDEILAQKAATGENRIVRRQRVAEIARKANIPLASHDDRGPEDVVDAASLGARIVEFPLTLGAAERAQQLGLDTVLGAPNAVRGRSTSPGNILVAEAVAAGVCDILCSDYLPQSLQTAVFSLVSAGATDLGNAVDLVSTNPAAAIGLPEPTIEVGKPLTAALGEWDGTDFVNQGLWREGQLTFSRNFSRKLEGAVLV